jgi:hypothetical protein
MRHIVAAVLAAAAAARGLAATPTQHEALAAIATLEKSVAGPEALAAARTIVTYAQLSDDVLVDIGPDEIPWAEEHWGIDDERERSLQSVLLASFVAGDVRSQIKNNRVEDDTYSGWIFVIGAYNRLRQKEHFSSPSIDSLLRMQSSGTLLQHAREVEARASQDEEPAEKKPMA